MSNTTITRAVTNAVRDVISNPAVPADLAAVAPIAEAVAPIVAHATNTEVWWRSRVTLGSLTGIVAGAITILTGVTARSLDPELYASGLAAVLGGSFALYGRWVASRPLGTTR